jgi:hypothetical protein
MSPSAPAALALVDELAHAIPAHPVDLEEDRRTGLHDVLDRLARKRAQPDDRSRGRRGAGDGELAIWMDRLHAGGRDDHRERDLLAEHGRHEVSRAGNAGPGKSRRDAGHKPELSERRHVVLERDAPLRAG